MISKDEVVKLAQLARLELSEQEVESLQKDISNILDYVGQVSAVAPQEVTKEVPLWHNIMRQDALRAEGDLLAGKREVLLQALPKREGDFNVVRKIIQKDDQ